MTADLLTVAALLQRLRGTGRIIPVGAVEALLRIGAGVDSVTELAAAMGTDDTPLPPASISRLVSLLRGRARYDKGEWRESPYGALIEVRKHPHRKGLQLLLSAEGMELLSLYLGQECACTTLLGVDRCAPVEEA